MASRNWWRMSSYLQDKFLLFHLVTACVCRLLLATGPARSGREQRGVFISSSVASSGGREKGKMGTMRKVQPWVKKYHSTGTDRLWHGFGLKAPTSWGKGRGYSAPAPSLLPLGLSVSCPLSVNYSVCELAIIPLAKPRDVCM